MKRRLPFLASGFASILLACTGSVDAPDPDEPKNRTPVSDDDDDDDNDDDTPRASSGECLVNAPATRLTNYQYEESVKALFDGKVKASENYPLTDGDASPSGFSTSPEANLLSALGAERMLEAAEDVALEVAANIEKLVPCASRANKACAQEFISTYGPKAFGRPLERSEEDALVALYEETAVGDDAFVDGIAVVTATMLQSPQFLYPTAVEQPEFGEKISGRNLATRLARVLWNAPPDAELLESAENGELDSKKGIRRQAQRLLEDARAAATVVRFGREWAHMPDFSDMEKDDKAFTPALAAAMSKEFDGFVGDHLASPDFELKDLFTTNDVRISSALASHYGVEGSTSSSKATALDSDERGGGLLTLASFLAAKAHPDKASYVMRGHFVLERMLCVTLPEPPADALEVADDLKGDLLPPQRAESIQGIANCQGCHVMIDPLGLAFERYDELGRIRDEYKDGTKIKTEVDLDGIGLENEDPVDGVVELANRLADEKDVTRCVATQVFQYAFGRTAKKSDSCVIDQLVDELESNDGNAESLWLGLVTTDAFRKSAVQEGQ